MKILVYGAGVLGSLYAARLHEAGHEVSILARGERLGPIRQQGIVLVDALTGRETRTPVPVVERLDPEDAYDLALVLVRRNQLAGVLPALAANRAVPAVLFMVNNPAGAGELASTLGRERVLLGFPGAAGTREGHAVRYVILPGQVQPTTCGELDGSTTPRLRRIIAAMRGAGFPAAIEPDMDAWLKTHVAWISPLANALYMAGGDSRRLARTRDGVVLMVRAIREGFQVLRELGYPITPARLRLFAWAPEPLLVGGWQRLLATRWAEVAIAGHANAARDEMRRLADEFEALAREASTPTPAIDCLAMYADPDVSPVAEGRAEIPLRWRSLWAIAAAVGALAAAWRLLELRRRRAGGRRGRAGRA